MREDDDGVVRVFVGNLYERQYYLEDCSDGVAQKWTAGTGTWAVTGGGYRQSATTSNTNAYRAWAQGSAFNYEWQATYTSGTSAGFYLFASASTGAERGNSYRIWQDATTVQLYESANNVATQRASWAAANAAGQSHTYQVSYDPLTGSFSVKRDGATLGSWTDTTPLQNGNYVALRTDAANVLFDDIQITRESKYYYAGSQRVAVRHNNSAQVNYLLGDHLGSTALTTNQAGARLTELRYYPWGAARYNPGAQVTKARYTGQQWDGGTGLYYYGARWYDPQVGRFLQADTLVPSPGNPQSLNRYSYVGNRPTIYRDPSGHCVPGESGCPYDEDGRPIGGYTTRAPRPTSTPTATPTSPNACYGGSTSILCAPTATPTATMTPLGPWMGAGTPNPPTVTPTATGTRRPTPTLQPGQINGQALVADWAWETMVEPLLVNIGLKTGIRAGGRGLAVVPVIGARIALVASVGPNLYTNVFVDHAPARTVILQATTDAIGVPVSMAGGAIATFVGGLAGLDPTDAALPLLGGMGTSVLYDQFAAPRVYRRLDMGVSSLGW